MNTKKLDTSSRDAISSLPDEVLADILSLLPIKQAASTSVLSKRWTNVFRLAPVLGLDGYVSLHPEDGKPKRGESFRKFLDRTKCDSPIKKFSILGGIRDEDEMAFVSSLICDVVQHGVLEVELRIVRRFLCSQLFMSKNLVKLTLGTNYIDEYGFRSYVSHESPPYVSLPSLKILFVDTVFFGNRDLSDVILAGCPVLEELIVHHKDMAIPHTIISPSVKRLLLDYISFMMYDDGHLSLDLPNLVYLDYAGFALTDYEQANLDSLVEAKLDLHLLKDNEPDLTKLIVGIRNVEILHLSSNSVDVICQCVRHRLLLPPMFNNLVNLSFGSKNTRGWKLFAYLLQSPKIETLSIQDLNGYNGDFYVPSRNKVKTLHILNHRGTPEELKQLKSFLGKFKCLELVQVDVTQEDDDDRRLQTERDLMKLLGVSLPSKCLFKVT